ncbi:MAG: Arc family DNA-binding protein [Bacteroidia bacterium]|nr:MAG: Arc family DNA-binding protein [Bacteroidia bacterium]
MSKKKPFVLRLSPEMMNALEKWAADEFRSVNGQIEWIINRALRESGRLKKNDEGRRPEQGSVGRQQARSGGQEGVPGREEGEGPDSVKKNK